MNDRNWYKNEDVVKDLKVKFEKAGLPLEYRARKIFEDNGFEANSQLYRFPLDGILDESVDEKEGIWRQIDIDASSIEAEPVVDLQFGKSGIALFVGFTAECKFSSEKSFFLFKSSDNSSSNFPLCLYGENILPFRIWLQDPNEKRFIVKKKSRDYFNFNVYENIVEVDVSKRKQKNDNYNDKITYEACEQLYYAINYAKNSLKNVLYGEISEEISKSKLFDKWIKYVRGNNIKKEEAIDWRNKVRDDIALDFLNNNFELTDIEGLFHLIDLKFPVLIINEEAGLFEVELDENNIIVDFRKIKYGIYGYVSKKSKPTRRRPDSLGVLICDIAYLNELISAVLEGLKKLGDDMSKLINERPYLIGYELLFNPEIMDLNDLF